MTPEIHAQDIAYACGDQPLTGYLADGADDGPAPGVLVLHQGGGLSAHTRQKANALAALGYVVFAADMYGETVDFASGAEARNRAMALLGGLTSNPALWKARVEAGLNVLLSRPNVDPARIGAIGHCFGGTTVIEMARELSAIRCAVAFHAGITDLPETDPRPVYPRLLVCAGARDPLIPPAMRTRFVELMEAAGADYQLIVYGGAGHSFTDESVAGMNIPGFAYDARTDQRSWAAMRALFQETFGAV